MFFLNKHQVQIWEYLSNVFDKSKTTKITVERTDDKIRSANIKSLIGFFLPILEICIALVLHFHVRSILI
jgi:hypothetical protein